MAVATAVSDYTSPYNDTQYFIQNTKKQGFPWATDPGARRLGGDALLEANAAPSEPQIPSRQAGLDDPPAPPVVVGGGISWEGVLWDEPFLPLLWTTLSAPGFWVSFSTEGAGLNDLLRRFLLLSEPLGS